MKVRFIILFLIYPVLTGFITGGKKTGRMDITSGYIDITVESNINKLFFKYDLEEKVSPFQGIAIPGDSKDTSAISIYVPVRDFHCTNYLGYKDFLELLKANQYPYLSISFPRAAIKMDESGHLKMIRGVLITIAGFSKEYDISCRIGYSDKGDPVLIGSTKIMLTDLEIKPPVKSLGLIKIKNEIIVNFGFSFNEEGSLITKT